MPIKFRCRHCRQFLGISRSQAGEITNCPQCGKMIRIPNLDGSVTPIPPPKLNLEDSELADALNQLATLEAEGKLPQTIEEPNSPHFVVSQPASSSTPRAQVVEQPATVIAEPVVSAEPLSLADDTANESASAQGTHDVLAGLAQVGANQPSIAEKQSDDRRLLKIGGSVAGLLALVVAAAMFLRGGNQQPGSTSGDGDHRSVEKQIPATAEHAGNEVASQSEPALTGRVTYVSDTGDTLPDSGAVIVLLPRPRVGQSKLDVTGFLPGAEGVDAQFATVALRALGGDVSTADADGRYQLSVTGSGDFQLLAISHHQRRDTTLLMETRLQELLSDYFFRPSTLLGQLAFDSDDIHYHGQGTSPRDISFVAE